MTGPTGDATWQHAANEWADTACNALDWLENIRDGISTADQAIENMKACVAHCREVQPGSSAPTGEKAGDVVDWTDNDVETLRNLRDAVGKYANLKKLWVPTIDKMLARARHVDNPAFMPYAKPRPVGVPDPHTKDHYEQDEDEQIDTYSVGHMDGWNSCREAMLAAAPARGEGGEA